MSFWWVSSEHRVWDLCCCNQIKMPKNLHTPCRALRPAENLGPSIRIAEDCHLSKKSASAPTGPSFYKGASAETDTGYYHT